MNEEKKKVKIRIIVSDEIEWVSKKNNFSPTVPTAYRIFTL